VRQIETHGACHLDAGRIAAILPGIAAPRAPRILFIENIGNLVCPSAFDLGEHVRVALLSVTEGEDKPLKYPALFAQASVVIITKTDLLPHLDFDLAACRRNLRCLKPDVLVIETSSRTGKGLGEWITYLKRLLA
jgi:hydrogenase nickel incorporation protein HypB